MAQPTPVGPAHLTDLIDDSQVRDLDSDPLPLALRLITQGDIAIFGMNCRVMCEIGIRLRQKSPFREMIIVSLYENAAGGRYLVDKWGYVKRTFAYYRCRRSGRT